MPAVSSTLADLTSRRRDPSAPLITYYDMSTGERVELSGTTTANWVAKTSNLLVDDLDAEVGTRIRIGLPAHWLRFVWLLSAWNVGAAVVTDSADIGISGPDLIGDEEHRLAASLRPLGGRFLDGPGNGFLDLAIEVPSHSDYFIASETPGPETIALDLKGAPPATHADLLASTPPDARRLITTPTTIDADARLVVAACLGGGSLVIVSSATSEQYARVASQEAAESLCPIP